ncbi:MAG: serine O-acetyltransferase, partial [Buchnera aphidicola]|nr:serine O-acetyltransferase [Buchnera aphidicola]
KLIDSIYCLDPNILTSIIKDIKFIVKNDPVVTNYSTVLLYFKGFHALESYRISHYLWNKQQYELSLYLQSIISRVFSVDIHPAAKIGSSIMVDHATGVVIGSSVIIEDSVIVLQSVTLGGTGKDNSKNRHPKIRKGVVIGAGAKVLGNIEVGIGSKIGAGAVV